MFSWICPKCEKKIFLPSKYEVERGWCATCEVNSWSQEKRNAFRGIVEAFAQGASREEMDAKIDEATKYDELP